VAQRHKSAVKRHRQSVKLAERNRVIRTHVRHSLRTLREAIGNKDTASAQSELRSTIQTLDKAVTQGVLHRNNAARRIARLSRQVAELKA